MNTAAEERAHTNIPERSMRWTFGMISWRGSFQDLDLSHRPSPISFLFSFFSLLIFHFHVFNQLSLRAWYRLCCLMVAKLGGQLLSVLLVVFIYFISFLLGIVMLGGRQKQAKTEC